MPRSSQAARVLEVLQTSTEFACYASARDVAQRAGVNASTVIRAARRVGCTGWSDLQMKIRRERQAALCGLESLDEHTANRNETPTRAALRRDVSQLSWMAKTLGPAEVRDLADAIGTAPRTLVAATDSFTAPAIVLSRIGTAMGYDIRLDTTEGTQRAAQIITLPPGSCLVIFNFCRPPRELIAVAEAAARRGITVCLVTDRTTSRLAHAADLVVSIPSEGASVFPSLTPAVALSQAVLTELATADIGRVTRTISDISTLQTEMELLESTGGPAA